MVSHLLSKSKYLTGLQCPKLMWVQINNPERIPETDTFTQHMFDQGHQVGEYAKKLFPDGIDIPQDDFMANVFQTKDLLSQRRPLFEAGIFAGQIYSRVDILNPGAKDEWDIIEVKSSTSVKDVHIDDVSFQMYCCQRFGLKVRKCFLSLINSAYVKNGEIDPNGLFTIHDITDQVIAVSEGIQNRIEAMLETVKSKTCPEVSVGKYCREPYECPLTECWEFLPENSIFDLRGGKTTQFSLYEQGILSIKDVPDDILLSRQQKIQRECVITGNTHIEKQEIRKFLNKLIYPLYYLDFETIGPAIPIYDGMRPYQNIPFQFSLHIVKNGDSDPVHYSFLAEGRDDPRPQLLSELKRRLGSEGSIIAYNSGFEEGILRELAEIFLEYTGWFESIRLRIIDLLAPFSRFHYYHASQKDTASLKKVLPAVTGKSYEDMNIGAGMDASIAYERITYGNATEEEISQVRADLEKYCALDTEGMIWIVDKLKELSA